MALSRDGARGGLQPVTSKLAMDTQRGLTDRKKITCNVSNVDNLAVELL
jgi:hypothetical protein